MFQIRYISQKMKRLIPGLHSIALFFATSGLSAFLLFMVQPIMGKKLLPLYGGSAAVWTTCLLFFQSVLLAGYIYAHLLTRHTSVRYQLWLHGAVLVAATLFSRILPESPLDITGDVPIVMLLFTLLRHVGLPFFALSATAPLVQHWFYLRFPSRSPYPIYAVSNAGSFTAVLTYPFLVERLLPLDTQELVWRGLFVVFAAACMTCAWLVNRRKQPAFPDITRHRPLADGANSPLSATPNTQAKPARALPSRFLWFGFSAAGSVLLLTTTERLSQDVAATPLLWMLPLCLYLLSFAICFSRDTVYRRRTWLPILCVTTIIVILQIFMGNQWAMPVQLALYAVTLSVGCMVAHGELAALKPDASALTDFYLWTSFGGIVGGITVAVVAPALFPDLWEYSLLWPILFLLIWHALSKEIDSIESELGARMHRLLLALGIVVSGIGFVVNVVHDNLSTVYSSRNFYGRITISETRNTRCLYHGQTLHGCQPKKAETLGPAFYYAPQSGMGMAQQIYREIHRGPVRTGVVGLGAGICSVWNQPGDTMIFYEIDPDVIAVAGMQFDYLKKAKGTVRVVPGDARLTLAAENRTNAPLLDILVMDAFSSDAIPLHLLTIEAINIYRQRVRAGGVLVFHISNRHLNLEPLMQGIAEHISATPYVVYTTTDYANYILDTTWVIITDNDEFARKFLASPAYSPWPEKYAEPLVFSDQYSNILDLF
jgi:hypothetical protein